MRSARRAATPGNAGQTPEVDGFDPGTYGRSFADVYDDWYPADATTEACVRFLSDMAGPGGSLLELGVGTGRIAVPLAAAGHAVTGIDASEEMLVLLRDKDPHGCVEAVRADVGDPDGWTADSGPIGRFDVVVAVCNLLCNLTDPAAQAACITGAASALRPGGHLVVEAFEPAPLTEGRRSSASEVRRDVTVRIETDVDSSTGVVTGRHIEVSDAAIRIRPWRIRVTAPAEIDDWAEAAGLELVERLRTWGVDGPPSDGLVSVYRRRLTAGHV